MDKKAYKKWIIELPDGVHYFARYFKGLAPYDAKVIMYELIQSGELQPGIELEMSTDFKAFIKKTRPKTYKHEL